MKAPYKIKNTDCISYSSQGFLMFLKELTLAIQLLYFNLPLVDCNILKGNFTSSWYLTYLLGQKFAVTSILEKNKVNYLL